MSRCAAPYVQGASEGPAIPDGIFVRDRGGAVGAAGEMVALRLRFPIVPPKVALSAAVLDGVGTIAAADRESANGPRPRVTVSRLPRESVPGRREQSSAGRTAVMAQLASIAEMSAYSKRRSDWSSARREISARFDRNRSNRHALAAVAVRGTG
jgi:hypothetical protein